MRVELNLPGYELQSELGSGAAGTVYRAVQLGLGRQVAIKLLAPGLFDETETRARFLRESKLQARLADANLVAIFDAGILGNRPYLVMEYVPGGSLRQVFTRRGPLPAVQAIRIAKAIASGLAAAHSAGVIHRDLKPENVLLTPEGLVKVADFGLAKATASNQTFQSASGLIVGTPGYIAPEVILGRPATPAADLYAIGVILFEALTGRRPFSGSVLDTLKAQLGSQPPLLSELVSGLPPGLEPIVTRCLERQPQDRPESAAAVAESLGTLVSTGLVADLSLGDAGPPVSSVRTRVSRRSMPAAVTARVSRPAAAPKRRIPTTVVVLSAACGAFALWHARPRPRREPAPAVEASAIRPPAKAPPPSGPARTALAPRLRLVTAGLDRVRVYLDGAIQTGASVSVALPGAKPVSKDWPEESPSAELEHLPSGAVCKGSVRVAGGGDLPFDAETLKGIRGTSWSVLEGERAHPNEQSLTRSGDALFLTWTGKPAANPDPHTHDREVAACESLDGGWTWSHPRAVAGEPGRHLSVPNAVSLSSTFFAAWSQAKSIEDGPYSASLHPFRDGTWMPAVPVPRACWPGPALNAAEGGAVEMLVPRISPGSREASLWYWRTTPDGHAERPPRLQSSLPAKTYCLTFRRLGGRTLAVAVPGRTTTAPLEVAFGVPEADGARWQPWTLLTEPGQGVRDADAAVSSNKAVIAWELETQYHIWLAAANPTAREPLARVDPLASAALEVRASSCPAVAFDSGTFYLACAAFDFRPRFGLSRVRSLEVLRSSDGVSWSSLASVKYGLANAPRRLRLAVTPASLVLVVATDNDGLLVTAVPR